MCKRLMRGKARGSMGRREILTPFCVLIGFLTEGSLGSRQGKGVSNNYLFFVITSSVLRGPVTLPGFLLVSSMQLRALLLLLDRIQHKLSPSIFSWFLYSFPVLIKHSSGERSSDSKLCLCHPHGMLRLYRHHFFTRAERIIRAKQVVPLKHTNLHKWGKFLKKLWCCVGGRIQQGNLVLVTELIT